MYNLVCRFPFLLYIHLLFFTLLILIYFYTYLCFCLFLSFFASISLYIRNSVRFLFFIVFYKYSRIYILCIQIKYIKDQKEKTIYTIYFILDFFKSYLSWFDFPFSSYFFNSLFKSYTYRARERNLRKKKKINTIYEKYVPSHMRILL